jgi:hypothetical protein
MKLNRTYLAVWRAVVSLGGPSTIAEIREVPAAADAAERSHSTLAGLITNLARRGFLSTDGGGTLKGRYWFGQYTKLPEGEPEPQRFIRVVDSSIAAPRCSVMTGTHDVPEYRSTRPDAYDYQKHPSRDGNLLKWRNGRIERIESDGTQTLVQEGRADA